MRYTGWWRLAMLRAIIFDFDGVLADDEPLHLEAFQQALAERGITLDAETYYQRYLGFDDRECVRQALSDHGQVASLEVTEVLVGRKQHAFMAAIARGVRLFPGVPDFVQRAAAAYRLAIASGALRDEIETILATAGLRGHFGPIASADDIAVGKPDPAVFQLALARLNEASGANPILTSECLVIEDSIAGVEGARRAGMRCVAVTNSYDADVLTCADLVVPTLEGLELAVLEALFEH